MFKLNQKLTLSVCFAFLVVAVGSICFAQNNGKGAGDKELRGTVQNFFSRLKSQKYSELYDFLPSELQKQTTREQLTTSLKRLESSLTIERLEIGRVQQHSDLAVVDTTIYGSLKRAMNMNGEQVNEGRIAVQQYLLKEGGQWKLVTADNRAKDFFLKRNPNFKQQFQLTQPQFAFKQAGKWTPFGK